MSVRSEEESYNVLVSCTHGDVKRSPAVASGQSNIGAVADKKLDQFQVAYAAAPMQGGLAVLREDVDVDRLRGDQAGAGTLRGGRRRRGACIRRVEQTSKATGITAADRVEEMLMVTVVRR